MTPPDPIAIPWPSERTTQAPRPVAGGPTHRAAGVAAASLLLGAGGPLVAILRLGDHARRDSIVVSILLAVTAAALAGCHRRAARAIVAAIAMGAVIALDVPSVGKTPAALGLFGVLAAHAAVTAWPLSRPHARPEAAPVPLALTSAAAAGLVFVRTGQRIPAALLLGLTVSLVGLDARWPAPGHAVSQGVLRGVRWAVHLVATAALFAVACVVLYPAGLARRALEAAQHRGRRRPTALWSPVAPPRRHPHRAARDPFTPATGSTVARHLLAGVVVVAVAGAALTWQPEEEQRPRVTAPVGAEADPERRVDWDAVAREHQAVPLPLDERIGHSVGDHRGRYVNVTDGVRRSTPSTCDTCPALEVWLIGGSAAFGLAQRDEFTIASELVKVAQRDDIALHIENHAVPGWTAWQALEDLRARLPEVDDPPDLVIAYDGFNDVTYRMARIIRDGSDSNDPVIYDEQALEAMRRAADDLTTLHQETEDLLAERGVELLTVFQPDALASAHQRRTSEQFGAPDAVVEQLGHALFAAERVLGREAGWSRNLFDGDPREAFADLVHNNEYGASRVAAALYERHRAQIRRLAGAPS